MSNPHIRSRFYSLPARITESRLHALLANRDPYKPEPSRRDWSAIGFIDLAIQAFHHDHVTETGAALHMRNLIWNLCRNLRGKNEQTLAFLSAAKVLIPELPVMVELPEEHRATAEALHALLHALNETADEEVRPAKHEQRKEQVQHAH